MIKVGIVGGTGFTGGELLRILVNHREVEIAWVYSRACVGKSIQSVHSDLDELSAVNFVDQCDWAVDLVFLCLPHETAKNFVDEQGIPSKVRIIDLSRDYRLGGPEGFVYGLPELQRSKLQKAKRIANPGCFATCIQLGLLPLADDQVLDSDIHITGITGSTGAGKGLSPTTHFTWRTGNISIYKALNHQHIPEVKQSILQMQPSFNKRINFIPMRGNFTRGILVSIYMDTKWTQKKALATFKDYFLDHPFVVITDLPVDMKEVVNTNKAKISVQVIDKQLHIVSVIDNLVKGASGQAVQNMNLMFGFEEITGLNFKSIAY